VTAAPDQTATRKRYLGHRLAYGAVMFMVLLTLALLPFAVVSVVRDATDESHPIYVLLHADVAPDRIVSLLKLEVTAVNEWDGTAAIRVSLHQTCDRNCPWGDRYLFVSLYGERDNLTGTRPASETVTLPATQRDVTQTIRLPLFGDPIRYPFDRYHMGLGIILYRILPDGFVQTLTAEEAHGYVAATLEARVPRITMHAPMRLDPDKLQPDSDIEPYITVVLLTFERPLYLKVLTILLVILVTAAAAYAVFMRPLDQLIINSGALVLGVWGVRAVLLGTNVQGVTAVDLALSVVILFLLVTITVRTLWLLEGQSGLRLVRRLQRPPPAPAAPREPERPAPQPRPDDLLPGRAAELPVAVPVDGAGATVEQPAAR
jgi:hypothetical protein